VRFFVVSHCYMFTNQLCVELTTYDPGCGVKVWSRRRFDHVGPRESRASLYITERNH
jgi:hypothetical protein